MVRLRVVLWLSLLACLVAGLTGASAAGARTLDAPLAIGPGQFAITASAGAGGSISPEGDVGVDPGGSQDFIITATTGYHILDVVVDGNSVGDVSTYTFTDVNEDHTIAATFAIDTYTITVAAGAGGSITPGTGDMDYGSSPTYTITPNTGYHIASLTVDGTTRTVQNSWTFTNVAEVHSIAATFAIDTFAITVTQSANGTISPATGTVNSGASPTYTVTPAAGFHIASLTVDGGAVTVAGSYTFTNVTANHTIAATFAIDTFTINVTQAANGTISPVTGTVNSGASPTYTVTPASGYHIASLTVDGAVVAAADTHTFTNVTANHSITATFAIDTFTITVTQAANGTISPDTGTVDSGTSPTYTITPATGYHIASLTVDGAAVTAASTSYTFTNVTANHSITAAFAIDTYMITVTPGANGSISPVTGTVDSGTSPTYTITPNPGYHIVDVLVDGGSVGAVGTYTFTNVIATHTIAATFAIDTFTITATTAAHGSISPAGATVVDYGGDMTFSLLPDVSYRVADVVVDGVSQGPVASYTFKNVTAAHTISASFTYGVTTRLSIDLGLTTVTYGGTTTISATLLRNDGTPVAGGSVALWATSSPSGGVWTLVETLTTSTAPGSAGTCSAKVTPRATTYYSLRYTPAQGSDDAAALSDTVFVKVRPLLGTPAGPTSVKMGKTFTVSGSLAPHFAKGTATVQVRMDRLRSGHWKSIKRLATTIADSGAAAGSYSVRLKLLTRGTYRFRAEFPAAAGWAGATSQYSGKTRVR